MGNGHKNDDDDDRKDLTRIEDLSEFLHEEDPDLESKFGDFNQSYHKADGTSTGVLESGGLSLTDLTDLDESPPELPVPQESSEESSEEPSFESSFESASLETPAEETLFEEPPSMEDLPAAEETAELHENFSFEETNLEDTPLEETPLEEMNLDEAAPAETFGEEASFEESSFDDQQLPSMDQSPVEISPPERFEEVKTFAQNFSYGQIQGGGNPPFSIVIRHLKYEEDKESILSVLSEFGLVTEQNHDETMRALNLGSLLIPQISEYSAIILAHKLRRFDCDLEVGLSDEVHPSKSGEQNPKGLVKKDSLRQNIAESYQKTEETTPAREMIISTTSQLEGYVIKKYIGVQTSFAIVDEEELERLKFVQQQARANHELHDYHPEESDDLSSERAFLDYKSSFDYLFVTLAEELKSKARKEKANALLGLNYQLQSLPFEKTSSGKNCYQLTASATMAWVTPE